MTQAAAARAIGAKRELVSMWETEARVPSLRQLEELARLYRANVGYLLGEEELDERREREALYGELDWDAEAKLEVERWLDFLDDWAEFLEDVGQELPGPSRPPRDLDEGQMVVDARRAPKLAAAVREYYWLDLTTAPVDLYAFFEEAEVALVYRAPLGDIGRGSEGVSGAFYNHPKLGYSILVNADTAPGRQAFTMAHEFAHALFHYQTVGVISRKGDRDPKERFADIFAAHFLVPSSALRELAEPSWKENGVEPYRAVSLAAHFQVSYATLLYRLRQEGLIPEWNYENLKGYSPSAMARQLGLETGLFRIPERRPLYLERYPISVLEWVKSAVEEEELSHAQAADLLKVDVVTFRHQIGLLENPPEATREEEQEFDQLPPRVA
ncbi:ImmA/IrrE family metallo-endopeptidase [Rubrobacter marinus]|uniref:ImmA/IrrE family metallo-endopeptidase n=1 Tax=Rubrobacter marinus TaxID=2653852 RepID=UPI00140B77B3